MRKAEIYTFFPNGSQTGAFYDNVCILFDRNVLLPLWEPAMCIFVSYRGHNVFAGWENIATLSDFLGKKYSEKIWVVLTEMQDDAKCGISRTSSGRLTKLYRFLT